MRIVADENIIFAGEAFAQYGTVLTLHGRKITNEVLKDADILIVRSITRVDEKLLQGTPVKFVGTATIGTDHLDLPYLSERGIYCASAQGCNAQSVAEYITGVISRWCNTHRQNFNGLSLGIVGVGNIGKRVAAIGNALGFTVLMNDPPREENEPDAGFLPLNKVLSADIVTFHTPLIRSGNHPTFHLLNRDNVTLLPERGLLVNASRGEVTSSAAVIEYAQSRGTLVLDVFENEPAIDTAVLQHTLFASPHTAGYSVNGKINGTVMMADAVARCFGLNNAFVPPPLPVTRIDESSLSYSSPESFMDSLFSRLTALEKDTAAMRKIPGLPAEQQGAYFDGLRKDYDLRSESSEFALPSGVPAHLREMLSPFNFRSYNN